MRNLADALAELGRHPRAVAWRIRLHARWASAGNVREHVVFAPALGRSVWPVLARAHNAALLYNPAAVEIVAPLAEVEIAPVLALLRAMHNIPFVLAPALVEPHLSHDVPVAEAPAAQLPGEGVAIGLDIGGTGMKVVALNPASGVIVGSGSAATWPEGEQGIESLITRARALIVVVADGRAIGSLGIGLAAPMGVGGRVLELSTILRERVGTVDAFDDFAQRVATDLVTGPVAIFNDLSNLGRHLSAQGARRLVRLQIGTSFGGSWIDADGAAVSTEMGRLVVDVSPDALPHTYLPIRGAMRTYLSNIGVAKVLSEALAESVAPSQAGHRWRAAVEAREPAGDVVLAHVAEALVGVTRELSALLLGLDAIECGGSMLGPPIGKLLAERVAPHSPVPFRISTRPGEDGAIAAALAPRVDAPLRGLLRVD
jgi:predicted NBD/HSP70 family sugar kinase